MQFSITIPQIFFDLIARVIPGSLFLIMLSYELSNTGIKSPFSANLPSDLIFVTLLVLIGSLMSYLMGWVLQSFSFQSAEKKIEKEYESTLESQKVKLATREMYDLIRIKDEASGFRIAKRRAEAHMLECSRAGMFYVSWIAIGLVLLNTLGQLPSSSNSSLEWTIKVFIPIILTFAFWKQERRAWQGYYHSVISHYKVLSLAYAKEKSKVNTSPK
jgi:hypothetical protein